MTGAARFTGLDSLHRDIHPLAQGRRMAALTLVSGSGGAMRAVAEDNGSRGSGCARIYYEAAILFCSMPSQGEGRNEKCRCNHLLVVQFREPHVLCPRFFGRHTYNK
jgi:hypothetical protein